MEKLFPLALVLLLSFEAFATAQAPDVLIYDNKIYDLYANPLETFYKNQLDRPSFSISPGLIVSTGNWRGYVATWEIEEGTLYLRGIDSWLCDAKGEKCKKTDLKELFGDQCIKGKVKANWFSGQLKIPNGKQLQYVHMGYGSIYERDIILTVDAGKITGKKVVDNTKRNLPSESELQKQELEKLKNSPQGNQKTMRPPL